MSETNRIRTLIHTVTTAERSHSAIVTFLDEIWPLHGVYIHYNLKLHTLGREISVVTKLCIFVYITTHEHLIKYLDVV